MPREQHRDKRDPDRARENSQAPSAPRRDKQHGVGRQDVAMPDVKMAGDRKNPIDAEQGGERCEAIPVGARARASRRAP